MDGRSATHVVVSSAHHLGGRRLVALVDHVAAAGAAGYPRVHSTAASCPGAFTVLDGAGAWAGPHTNRETDRFRAHHADADTRGEPYPETNHNSNADCNAATHGYTDALVNSSPNADPDTSPNADTSANANAGSRSANVQPRLRHRDGERGVDQPDRERRCAVHQ
jgi:hypothetical protein